MLKKSDLVKRAEEILTKYGLPDWKVKFHTGGGLCVYEHKEIWLSDSFDLALILHEISHALCPQHLTEPLWMHDKTGHNALWADKFTDLVREALDQAVREEREQQGLRRRKMTEPTDADWREAAINRIVSIAKQMVGWIDGEVWRSPETHPYPAMRNALIVLDQLNRKNPDAKT